MKIVNRQQFLAMESGTLFSEYKPCIIRDLMIKLDTIYHDGIASDFNYSWLIGNIESEGSNHYNDLLTESEENGTEFKLDFDFTMRDGGYEEDALYAIYSQEDLQGLITCLSTLIKKPDHS